MKPSSTMLIAATCGSAAIGYVTGLVLGFAWVHPLPFFGVAMLAVLASMRLHPRHNRVAGVPVQAVGAVQGSAA